MIAPEHASKLLDDVIYERVLRHIDIEGLHMFEIELWLALRECGIESDTGAQARELIDRALARFKDDPVRIMKPSGPFGDCDLCDEEAGPVRSPERASRAH